MIRDKNSKLDKMEKCVNFLPPLLCRISSLTMLSGPAAQLAVLTHLDERKTRVKIVFTSLPDKCDFLAMPPTRLPSSL